MKQAENLSELYMAYQKSYHRPTISHQASPEKSKPATLPSIDMRSSHDALNSAWPIEQNYPVLHRVAVF